MLGKIGILVAIAALGGGAYLLMPVRAPVEGAAPAPGAATTDPAAMIPARLLTCTLGRITNFDPGKNQGPADYRFEGRHRFRLFLAAAPVRTGPPPSALAAPEPVDARTRILEDTEGLSRGAGAKPFLRVVDYWPERVEMATPISATASNLIVLDGFDAGRRSVNLFMTAATDGMTFDRAHLYAGACAVTLGADAEQSAAG